MTGELQWSIMWSIMSDWQTQAIGHLDVVGIVHLMQFAFGMME